VAAAVPVFVLFAWRVEPTEPVRPDQPVRERFALGPLAELLSRPSILYTTGLAMLGAFTWQATASFLPTFLEVGVGWSGALSALLFSLYFLVHGGTQPLTGSVSDRIGRDTTAMMTMGAGVVGYGLLVAAARFDLGLAVTVAGVGFVGVAMSWGAPVQSRFMDLLSDAERGAGFGLVRTAYMVLGASGSVVVGAVSDVAGWTVAFGVLAGVMGLGLTALSVNRLLGLGY
ncbi:MFS transporter, partial [Halorubrum sp. CBA1125]|uniref:MFS transporter n=1 Tax=Halorubrum sp. CBA1125 TaxID=2668072 RepID=UPI0012E7BEE9